MAIINIWRTTSNCSP